MYATFVENKDVNTQYIIIHYIVMYRNVRLSIDSFENDFEKENDVTIVKWRAVFIKYLETACINLVINIFDL